MTHTLAELVMGTTPVVTDDTRGFWEAALDHRLVAQRCAACDHVHLPPGPCCPRCLSLDQWWEAMSGRGSVFTFTVVRHAFHPAFADTLPYVLADIRLDEGPIIASNITDCPVDAVSVGMRVEVWFDAPVEDAFHNSLRLPKFRPAEAR